MSARNKVLTAVAGVAALAGAVVGTAGPASAAGTRVYFAEVNSGTHAYCASVFFESEGEDFRVYDGCSDGHSAAVEYKFGSSTSSPIWYQRNTSGFAKTVYFSHEWAEKKPLWFRACVYEGSSRLACGSWEAATA